MELALTVGLAAAFYPPATFVLGDRVVRMDKCSGFSDAAFHRQRSGLGQHLPGEEEPRDQLWLDPGPDG